MTTAGTIRRIAVNLAAFAAVCFRPWRSTAAGGLCGIAALVLLFAAALFVR